MNDDSLNKSQVVPTSPWEVRRLKADLIDNDTKVTTTRQPNITKILFYKMYRSIDQSLEKGIGESSNSSCQYGNSLLG